MEKMKRYLPTAGIVAILILGAYLRLHRISEYMTFLGDEGRDMLVVKRMIVDHKFTLLGPTASVGGFFLGPVYYYFMMPFVWAWDLSPVGAAVMVALFGTATVYLLYRFVRDMFDHVTGIIAAALYAVSPLVIAYSRSSWNPNLVPFFSIGFFYFLFISMAYALPLYMFLAGVFLGIGLQLHYLFLFLIPAACVWLMICEWGRGRRMVRSIVLGIAGAIVGYGPFLAFELRHGFPNTISIYRFLKEGTGTGFSPEKFIMTVSSVGYRVFGRLIFRLPPPEQWVNISPHVQILWDSCVKFSIVATMVLCVVCIAGWLSVPWITNRKSKSSWFYGCTLLSVWFVIPLFLFGFYTKGIYDYYFGIFFAVPFIGISLLLRFLARSSIGKLIAVVLFGILFWFNWLGRPFVYPPNNQLGQTEKIARAALQRTDGKPYNFALMTGGNSDHAYRYFFEIWGSPPVTIENIALDPERKSVTEQLIIICELQECRPLGDSLWEIAGFGRAEIADEWQVSFVKILKLVHYMEESPS